MKKMNQPPFAVTLLTLGMCWTVTLIVGAVAAPWLSPYDPAAVEIGRLLEAPSWEHWMGTDLLGRDVFSRLLYGSRISLSVGFVVVGIAAAIGILIGSVAAFWGGRVDRLLMSFVDVMLCFPTFFLILAVIAVIDQPGIFPIMVIIGLTSWMGIARLIRAEILSLKEREFVLAARSLGASPWRILLRHLIPNALGPVWVAATFGVASAILVESSLSFLGIGVQPPTPSWGNMLIDGKASLGVAWWLTLYPGLAILLTVLTYNLWGDFLREKFQVKT